MSRQIRPGQLQENVLYNISASFAISASHEITHEVSSSYAETASFAVTASHLLNNPPAFPFTGDAQITGSLIVSGTVEFRGNENTSTNVVIGPVLGATSANTVVIGNGAGIAFGGQRNVAIGDSAILANNTSFGVALGHSANVTGTNGIALGYSTIAQNGIAIGRDAESIGIGSIAIGRSITAPADQLRIGDENVVISASLDTGDVIISGSISSSRSNSTASFGTYIGDGSQLSGISTTPFPFVGDAVITGSLVVSGSGTQGGLRTNTRNIILGQGAGHDQNATNGPYNVMIGYQAGYTNTTGDSNVCIGQNAGYALSTNASDDNIFIGKLAGAGGTSPAARMSDANYNIGLGYETMLYLTSGDSNIGFGFRTMRNISSGKYNLAFGDAALYNTDTGQNNIGLGYYAGLNQTTGTGNITIGSGSRGLAGESNQLRIGHGIHGATISASLETGDVIFASTASAQYLSTPAGNLSSISASYALTASHALNGGGGGGIFTDSSGYKQTINNLIISESNASSSLSVINSGSTIFDVQGSVGQLFEVADGLDGVLMSVNDISGIPILTVSSSGDVFLAAGSTLQGTAATASFVPGISAAFPFTGSGAISGSLNINGSGSGIFDVDGTVGSLFSVNDGLDGILMSVNDISGLPLFEVSSSGDVEIHQGNISGSSTSTASFGHYIGDGSNITGIISASYALTASHALNVPVPTLQQVTDQGASTSNDITISGDLTASADISLPTNASSIRFNDAELHGRTGGSYPGLAISSGDSTNARIWIRDTNAGTSPVTMSFVGLGKITGVQTIESQGNWPLIIRGGKGPNDANDGVQIFTGDASNVYQQRFAIEADSTSVDAYFTNINGLGINDTTPSATLDVNGNINTTSHITASGNVSSSAASTASFGTYLGDGSQLTGLPSPTFISSGSTSASAAPNTGVVVEHSGSTAFSVIGDVGTLFAIDDDLTGTLLSVNDISGIPQLEVSASGLVEIGKGPLIANSFATGSIANGAPSSPLQMTIPSASSAQLFGVGGYFRASWDDGDSDHIWFEDDNIRLSYDLSGVDIEGTIMTDPASGEIHISLDKDGTRTALDKQVSDGIFDLNAVIGTDQTDRYIFAAPTDPTWPYYKIEVTRTSATHGSGFYAIVEKFI